MENGSRNTGMYKGHILGTAIVVIIGCLVTSGIFLKMHSDEEKALQSSFLNDAHIRADLISDELKNNANDMRGLAILMERATGLSREDFRHIVELIMKENTQITSLYWIIRVNDEEHQQLIYSLRKSGHRDFMIRERDARGDLVPANRRKEYYPILYVEPDKGNEDCAGFDLGSNPSILPALERARDTEKTAAAEQGGFGNSAGFVVIPVFEPVYGKGKPARSVAGRRAAFRGAVLGMLSIEVMMHTAVDHTIPADIPIDFTDLSAPPAKRFLYHWSPRAGMETGSLFLHSLYPDPPVYRRILEFAGRDYQVTAKAGLLYLKNHYGISHWLVLPFGLFLTMIMALYFQAILSRKAEAEELGRRRTAELAMNEQKYQSLFEQNKDGLVVCDLKGIIVDANRAVQDMTGFHVDEIRGKPYSDFIPERWKPYDAELISNELMKKGHSDFYERECIRRDGVIFPVKCRAWVIRSPERGSVIGVTIWFQDISERKVLEHRARLNQQRTESLIRITQTQFPTIRELLDYALDEAIKLTESRIGYIYNYDEMKEEFILNTWSSEVMKECTVKDRETLTRYELAHTGIWGEAVRQARPIIINDFEAPNPLKKGYPEGHVALKRFMTLPVVNRERIVAVVGVANKDIDYDDDDVKQLTLLMGSVWQITERRRAEESIKEFEQRYYNIFEDNLAVMLVLHPETGQIIDGNRAAVNYNGYGKTELTFMKITDINIMRPEEVVQAMQKAKTQMKNAFIFKHRLKNGEIRDVEVFSGPIVLGRKTFLYSIVHDITERRKTEAALKKSEERLRSQFQGFPVPTYIWKNSSDDFILVDYNNAALDFTQGKIAGYKGMPASLFYEGRSWIIEDMTRCSTDQSSIKNEFWDTLRTTGEKKYLAVRYSFLPPDLVMMHMEDITLQKEAQEHLVYMSIHDPMTGLYNRFYADSELARMKAGRKFPLSIIMVDLDGLKTVNDSLGHAAGDMFIKNAAYILRQTFRPEDMVARIGGDEFLILLPSVNTGVLDQTLRRLTVHLENFNATVSDIPVSFSVGAATASSGDKIQDCMKQADLLMYRDKALKKGLLNK